MTYAWRFRDEVVPDATNSVLRIENAGINNLGAYTVRVTDAGGSVDSRAANISLNVNVSPNFVPGLSIPAATDAFAVSWRE